MSTRMSIQASDIVWDTDGEEVADLPKTMSFEIDLDEPEPSEMEINQAITDHMSDATGWCVTSFSFDATKVEDAPAP